MLILKSLHLEVLREYNFMIHNLILSLLLSVFVMLQWSTSNGIECLLGQLCIYHDSHCDRYTALGTGLHRYYSA